MCAGECACYATCKALPASTPSPSCVPSHLPSLPPPPPSPASLPRLHDVHLHWALCALPTRKGRVAMMDNASLHVRSVCRDLENLGTDHSRQSRRGDGAHSPGPLMAQSFLRVYRITKADAILCFRFLILPCVRRLSLFSPIESALYSSSAATA